MRRAFKIAALSLAVPLTAGTIAMSAAGAAPAGRTISPAVHHPAMYYTVKGKAHSGSTLAMYYTVRPNSIVGDGSTHHD